MVLTAFTRSLNNQRLAPLPSPPWMRLASSELSAITALMSISNVMVSPS